MATSQIECAPGINDVRQIFLPDLLVIEDLARVLRITPAGVRAALRAGRLPGRRIGKRWFVSRAALLAHLASSNFAAEVRP